MKVEKVIKGYVAGSGVGYSNSHLSDLDGNVVCGTKNRFGMDCSLDIEIRSIDDYSINDIRRGLELPMHKGHLPLHTTVTCKRCLKYIQTHLLTI